VKPLSIISHGTAPIKQKVGGGGGRGGVEEGVENDCCRTKLNVTGKKKKKK
jgi:hypothetical protein